MITFIYPYSCTTNTPERTEVDPSMYVPKMRRVIIFEHVVGISTGLPLIVQLVHHQNFNALYLLQQSIYNMFFFAFSLSFTNQL